MSPAGPSRPAIRALWAILKEPGGTTSWFFKSEPVWQPRAAKARCLLGYAVSQGQRACGDHLVDAAAGDAVQRELSRC